MESAVVRSAREASLPATDEAGIRLARTYAQAIDGLDPIDEGYHKALTDLGGKLKDIITALGLNAAGRGVVKGMTKTGEVKEDAKSSGTVLELLQSQHGPSARANRTPGVHPSAS
jgi:hypothetical protein